MKTRYSPTTGTFYPYSEAYPDLPADLQDVDMSDFQAAMARPPGHTFYFDNGALVIAPPAHASYAAHAAVYLDAVRAARENILNRLAGLGLAAYVNGDEAGAQAIVRARQALLDIPECEAVAAASDIDMLTAAIIEEYRRIAAALPEEARRAFDNALA